MTRVKLLSKVQLRQWTRYFPDHSLTVDNCAFTFDPLDKKYDWLVVYDDFPFEPGSKRVVEFEQLNCPQSQTILVTTEPSSIKCYGRGYTAQFGRVLTSQEPWALPHPNRIYSQAGLRWFYGVGNQHIRNITDMLNAPPPDKTRRISAASSSKQQRHTLHHARYNFVQSLQHAIPELDIFGHGIRAMDDKAEAIDPYRFHVAIENHLALHHWTEKLSDAFLGFAVPIYAGAPNAADYFPPESFIPFDLKKPAEAIDAITRLAHPDEYTKRLPYICEARHLLLSQYGLFSLLSRHIGALGLSHGEVGKKIYSRHALRKTSLLAGIKDLTEKAAHNLLCKVHR